MRAGSICRLCSKFWRIFFIFSSPAERLDWAGPWPSLCIGSIPHLRVFSGFHLFPPTGTEHAHEAVLDSKLCVCNEWRPIQTWLPLTLWLQAWPLAPLLTLKRKLKRTNLHSKIFPTITVLLCPLTSKSLKFHFLPGSCLFFHSVCVFFFNRTLGNAGERQTAPLSCDVIRLVNLRRGYRHLRQRRADRWSSPAESVPLIVLVFRERRSSVSIKVWVGLRLRGAWE